jgi:hypothetical protein
MQIIRQPLPSIHLVNIETRLAISQWREEQEAPEDGSKDYNSRDPAS